MALVKKLTSQQKQEIINKSPLTLPDNPTQSGYSSSQIKQKMSGMVTDTEKSVLAALDTIVDNVNNVVNISVGNVVIFPALPSDLTPYEQMYILIKDSSNNIVDSYFVENGVANKARFGAVTNFVVSDEEPNNQLIGDLWYDITG